MAITGDSSKAGVLGTCFLYGVEVCRLMALKSKLLPSTADRPPFDLTSVGFFADSS